MLFDISSLNDTYKRVQVHTKHHVQNQISVTVVNLELHAQNKDILDIVSARMCFTVGVGVCARVCMGMGERVCIPVYAKSIIALNTCESLSHECFIPVIRCGR